MVSKRVLKTDEKDFASGRFADVRRGELVEENSNRRRVCLKRIKHAAKDSDEERMNREKVINSTFPHGRSVT